MHPLLLPLSLLSDVSSAVSILPPHYEHHTSASPIFTSPLRCILKPYFASMYSLIILLVTRSFGLYATALLAILYYQAALFLRIDNTIWLFSGQKHDTFNGITRFPQNLPYFFTITIYRKVKLNRL